MDKKQLNIHHSQMIKMSNDKSNITNTGQKKVYPLNGELCGRLSEIIESYEGKISTAEVIGILEMLKISIFDEALRNP